VFSVEDAAGNSRARERVDGLKKNQAASETRHTGVSALRASPIDRTADHWLTPAAIASRLCEPVRTNAKHKQAEKRRFVVIWFITGGISSGFGIRNASRRVLRRLSMSPDWVTSDPGGSGLKSRMSSSAIKYPMCNSFLFCGLTLEPTESASERSLGSSDQRNPRTVAIPPRQPVKRATDPAVLCRPRRGLNRCGHAGAGFPGVPLLLHPRLPSGTRFAG
jgi:hypothetical protein